MSRAVQYDEFHDMRGAGKASESGSGGENSRSGAVAAATVTAQQKCQLASDSVCWIICT